VGHLGQAPACPCFLPLGVAEAPGSRGAEGSPEGTRSALDLGGAAPHNPRAQNPTPPTSRHRALWTVSCLQAVNVNCRKINTLGLRPRPQPGFRDGVQLPGLSRRAVTQGHTWNLEGPPRPSSLRSSPSGRALAAPPEPRSGQACPRDEITHNTAHVLCTTPLHEVRNPKKQVVCKHLLGPVGLLDFEPQTAIPLEPHRQKQCGPENENERGDLCPRTDMTTTKHHEAASNKGTKTTP